MWFKCRNRMEKCRARELSEGGRGLLTSGWGPSALQADKVKMQILKLCTQK